MILCLFYISAAKIFMKPVVFNELAMILNTFIKMFINRTHLSLYLYFHFSDNKLTRILPILNHVLETSKNLYHPYEAIDCYLPNNSIQALDDSFLISQDKFESSYGFWLMRFQVTHTHSSFLSKKGQYMHEK